MKWRDLFENWDIKGIKLNLKFAELEFKPNPQDEIAAWSMYVELITRVSTQRLAPDHGDEQTTLKSIYSLFEITRGILHNYGMKCEDFTKLAVIILNQVVRPFTTKWHKLSIENAFSDSEQCILFRKDLEELQIKLRGYTRMLASMAKVEDLTDMELIED
ncbi:hypothetical protein AusDCA_2539 [Desulfitobacterium sp. AusDCA]